MQVAFLYDRAEVTMRVPDDAVLFQSAFPPPSAATDLEVVLKAVNNPIGSASLDDLLKKRPPGSLVVAVSDVTRPIPYFRFLPAFLAMIESRGVPREDILLLVATGMHRPTTPAERREMFGDEVTSRYRILDHNSELAAGLVSLPGRSWSGSPVRLNRHFVEAGFRITTGLVEPHFMAGFSGGCKTVCPGLAALDTIEKFHGAAFLSHPLARNGCLAGNPCHEEALSIARLVHVDFSLNVVLNRERRIVRAFAGGIEEAHGEACRFVAKHACVPVAGEVDVAVTSCGGYPLDTTFYQCVKAFVGCLPAVKKGGTIIALGGCAEGVGSPEYVRLMRKYSRDWRAFLRDIRQPGMFVKDQWEFQMHTRALEKVGRENLVFVTHGLPGEVLDDLSVAGISVPVERVVPTVQGLVDRAVATGNRIAVFPEGPYCVAV